MAAQSKQNLDTRVLFAGDPHGSFHQIEAMAARHRPAGMILLGDYELERPLHEALGAAPELSELWWIPGNHDFDTEHYYDHLFGSALADHCLHGRVVEIAGLRIAGLGGVFQGKVWNPKEEAPRFRSREAFLQHSGKGNRWRGGLPRKRRGAIWPEDVEALAAQQADILVTHEAPSSHRHGFSAIDTLAERMGVKLIVHGHQHQDYVARTERGNIDVYGVGLASVTDLRGHVLYQRQRR